MHATGNILEIKFSGDDISPEKISLDELSYNILLFDKLIRPIIEQENNDISLDRSYVGFTDLGNRSISLRYIIKQNLTTVLEAFTLLLISISDKDISRLPVKTINELDKISKFNEKWNCKAEFGEFKDENFINYVGFTNEFKSEKLAQIKGETTLYGYVERAGGEDHPSLLFLLPHGEKIEVSVTKEQAASVRLYSNVGIKGEATWKGKDLKLTAFKAFEIFEFNNLNAKDGFNFLEENFGRYTFDDL